MRFWSLSPCVFRSGERWLHQPESSRCKNVSCKNNLRVSYLVFWGGIVDGNAIWLLDSIYLRYLHSFHYHGVWAVLLILRLLTPGGQRAAGGSVALSCCSASQIQAGGPWWSPRAQCWLVVQEHPPARQLWLFRGTLFGIKPQENLL